MKRFIADPAVGIKAIAKHVATSKRIKARYTLVQKSSYIINNVSNRWKIRLSLDRKR